MQLKRWSTYRDIDIGIKEIKEQKKNIYIIVHDSVDRYVFWIIN